MFALCPSHDHVVPFRIVQRRVARRCLKHQPNYLHHPHIVCLANTMPPNQLSPSPAGPLHGCNSNRDKLKVLLYVPNLVGYIRIILFCIAALHTTTANPLVAYFMYLFTFVCDGIDGVLARRLNQVSLFGAFLDVTIDIAARGYLWVMCAPHPWGFFALFTEMLVFVCTHASASAQWKDDLQASGAPWLISKVMENGFRSLPGVVVVYGLMGTPLWLFANKYLPHSVFASPLVGLPALFGRMWGLVVEVYVIVRHVDMILAGDKRQLGAQAPTQPEAEE